MKASAIFVAVSIASLWMYDVAGQLRADMPQVIVPTPPASVPATIDRAVEFSARYTAAGSPRVALFWNVSFNDSASTHQRTVDTTTRSDKGNQTRMQQTTSGPAGNATSDEQDSTNKSTTTVVRETQSLDDSKRQVGIKEGPAAVLEGAFTTELNRADVVLVDRALTMRTTAAGWHRAGADPKLVEADALMSNADVLLEVLMIEDKKVPTGWGFNVRLKNIRQGTIVGSFYTTAQPPPRVTPGGWVTTDQGFAYQQGAPLPPTISEVGVALAHKVMDRLSTYFVAQGATR